MIYVGQAGKRSNGEGILLRLKEHLLNEEKESELAEFMHYVNMIVGILGHKVFEPLVSNKFDGSKIVTDGLELYYTYKGVTATCVQTSTGYVLNKGIKIFIVENPTKEYAIKNKKLQQKYLDKIKDGILIEDIEFSSPSTAANFFTGGNVNGRDCWKTKEGKTLKEVEESK